MLFIEERENESQKKIDYVITFIYLFNLFKVGPSPFKKVFLFDSMKSL